MYRSRVSRRKSSTARVLRSAPGAHRRRSASRAAPRCRCRRCGRRSRDTRRRPLPRRWLRCRARGTICRRRSRPSAVRRRASRARAAAAAPRAGNVRPRARRGSPERTDANVANARTSVAPAVAIADTATQLTRDHRSAFRAGASACLPCSTGSKRSPCFDTRSNATCIEKSRGLHVLVQLVPAKRRGHGRTRLGPHRIRRGDRLPPAVLAVIDEHAGTLASSTTRS